MNLELTEILQLVFETKRKSQNEMFLRPNAFLNERSGREIHRYLPTGTEEMYSDRKSQDQRKPAVSCFRFGDLHNALSRTKRFSTCCLGVVIWDLEKWEKDKKLSGSWNELSRKLKTFSQESLVLKVTTL